MIQTGKIRFLTSLARDRLKHQTLLRRGIFLNSFSYFCNIAKDSLQEFLLLSKERNIHPH